MKNFIKKILRQVTSGLTDVQIKGGYQLMDMITKGYQWYYDTPEHPFEHTPGSILLINPKSDKWLFELRKSGLLIYYYGTYKFFSRYLNMSDSDFELFIELWVEDTLKKKVVATSIIPEPSYPAVEDVIKNGKQMK